MKSKLFFSAAAATLLIASSSAMSQQGGARLGRGDCNRTSRSDTCSQVPLHLRQGVGLKFGKSRARNAALSRSCLRVPVGTPLEAVEEQHLLFMYEEEKMARDIYRQLGEQYPSTPVFKNIAASEDRHMAQVAVMLDRYSIDYTSLAANPEGVFTNSEIQEQFVELTALAGSSAAAAYRAGALVEELDIEDLDAAIASTTHEDLQCVYSNLRAASVNHLQAFVKNLERLGESYEPQVLSQSTIDELLAVEKSSRGKHRPAPSNT